MLRVVLDPAVMLRGLLNPHSLCGRLLRDYPDRYRALFSAQTIKLLRVLLSFPVLVVVIPELAKVSQRRLSDLFLAADQVQVPSEPDVSAFITLARAAKADYLVGQDPVLLSACQNLGIPTLDTRAFLSLLDPDLVLPPAPANDEAWVADDDVETFAKRATSLPLRAGGSTLAEPPIHQQPNG